MKINVYMQPSFKQQHYQIYLWKIVNVIEQSFINITSTSVMTYLNFFCYSDVKLMLQRWTREGAEFWVTCKRLAFLSSLAAYMWFKISTSGVRMSHWRQRMADGAKFWIGYQWLAFLINLSSWQLIQNSAPSAIMWCQCDIQIPYFLK